MTRCKSCGASIAWIKTNNGRVMPVDSIVKWYLPDEKGECIFVKTSGDIVRGTECHAETIGANKGYISHFATCPNASSHRKKR